MPKGVHREESIVRAPHIAIIAIVPNAGSSSVITNDQGLVPKNQEGLCNRTPVKADGIDRIYRKY